MYRKTRVPKEKDFLNEERIFKTIVYYKIGFFYELKNNRIFVNINVIIINIINYFFNE